MPLYVSYSLIMNLSQKLTEPHITSDLMSHAQTAPRHGESHMICTFFSFKTSWLLADAGSEQLRGGLYMLVGMREASSERMRATNDKAA